MGSPLAPLLANGWMNKHDHKISDDAKLFSRYVDDVLRSIHKDRIEDKLAEINRLHPSLRFTIEVEENNQIPFLDMKIIRSEQKLTSTWYSKPTDTGLMMNFHSLAPLKYKRSVVTGMVYRIFHACSTWSNFHDSLKKVKLLLTNNQYPESFYEPLIKQTLEYIIRANSNTNEDTEESNDEDEQCLIFLQYRGKITEQYIRSLHILEAPCKIVLTLRKLKTILPQLKAKVEKRLRSRVVYKITCSRCQACYVGQTDRHIRTRFREHLHPSQPLGMHLRLCGVTPKFEDKDVMTILQSTTRSIPFLETLEALWQRELKPLINTKDEYKSRELTIRL